MEVTLESILQIGKSLGILDSLVSKVLILEDRVKELEIELKSFQKSTHEVQFYPATEELPQDEELAVDEYMEDPAARRIAQTLFSGGEDMEDSISS